MQHEPFQDPDTRMKTFNERDPHDTLDDGLGPLSSDLFLGEPTETSPCILIVDDEPYVLRAIQRLLKSLSVEVLVASDGMQAIQELRQNSGVAVIISDQFMPGMSGADLLEHVREEHPDAVRVMLTGNNDLATAIEAINRGDVFRFVLKPWKNNELLSIVEMALKQHNIQMSYKRYQALLADQNDRLRELNEELESRVRERTRALLSSREEISKLYDELQESFDSTIQVLLSSMELGDIKIVDHCRRTAQRAQQLSIAVSLPEGMVKPLVRAGLLHWIGLVGAPTSMFAKYVTDLDVEEQAIWEFHTLLGQQVVQSVPALQRTGLIMLHYLNQYDDIDFRVGADIGNGVTLDEDLLLGCRILNICSAFERARTISQARRADDTDAMITTKGMNILKQGSGTRFDPNLVRQFRDTVEAQLRHSRSERKLNSITELIPGMILSRPIETIQGIPIAPQDIAITAELLRRFQLFHNTGGLGPIHVWTS